MGQKFETFQIKGMKLSGSIEIEYGGTNHSILLIDSIFKSMENFMEIEINRTNLSSRPNGNLLIKSEYADNSDWLFKTSVESTGFSFEEIWFVIKTANKTLSEQFKSNFDKWTGKIFKGSEFNKWTYDLSQPLEELQRLGYPFSMACFEISKSELIAIGTDDFSPNEFIALNKNNNFTIDITKRPKRYDSTLLGPNKWIFFAKKI